ncbi:MAG: L-histidine N(alpha)-methyltransferase [Acidobacteriota bacterium]
MSNKKKSVVFVGSSHESRRFAYAIQDALEHDADVRVWNQVRFDLSRTALDTLQREVDRADFAVFVFSPDDALEHREEKLLTTRDNVIFELGLFMGRLGTDRSFVLFATGTEKCLRFPSDLLGITTANFDYSKCLESAHDIGVELGPACNKVRVAIAQMGPRTHKVSQRVKGVLSRGSTEDIKVFADAGIHVAEDRHDYLDSLRRSVLSGELLPTKFLYWPPQGSTHWLQVCNHKQYDFYRQSLRQLRKNIHEIALEIIRANDSPEVDIVSVGSGNGVKDNVILLALISHLSRHELLYYYPIDISDALLVRAVRAALRGIPRLSSVRVKALVADYTKLEELQKFYEDRPARNLFSLLGNTIGNADESKLFDVLGDAMLDGDLLLLEFNTAPALPDDSSLNFTANKEHDFTPLACFNVPFDPEKLSYTPVTDLSVVPNTTSILSIYSAATIGRKEIKDVKLSVVHHYDRDSFLRELTSRLNISVLKVLEGPKGVCLVLAQKQAVRNH